jgi:hypothetical protein
MNKKNRIKKGRSVKITIINNVTAPVNLARELTRMMKTVQREGVR